MKAGRPPSREVEGPPGEAHSLITWITDKCEAVSSGILETNLPHPGLRARPLPEGEVAKLATHVF